MNTHLFSGFAGLSLCVALSTAAQTTQYVTIKSGSYDVQTNQILKLVGYDWYNRPTVTGMFPDGTQTRMSPVTMTNVLFDKSWTVSGPSIGIAAVHSPASYYTSTHLPTQIFTGLSSIWITGPSATFEITTPTPATVISNYVPADAIVIPASATGNVQIILESSQDLVNWTAANPGTYGPSDATNRFFRVRALVSP